MLKRIFYFYVLFLFFAFIPLLAQNKIDLNKATLEELKKVPGIGEVIAKNIIEYREKEGPFKNIEDLKKIKGIGEKKLELLRNYLTVGDTVGTSNPSDTLPFNETYPKERQIYYYKDEKGILHYTQFPETVPEKYRKTLRPLR
ncbi:hypothetical protein THC_0324 [Caldimicrobium thiodismutans]|jgi:competence protein ComEA|uniref:Helix-hairpin-helix DNA-binding motif class 1 domain-containing protein n=1 Tax=Caldimicrobium thiodismutans TaxID=1653476 RepID=A0A0U5ALK2_9BACT|nr:hypothetical protein THC_0324 [Caldimicrobium thiodismutans]